MKTRLIVVDDHEVVRRGVRELLATTPDLEVVAEAADGQQAERLARDCPADVMLLDIALPTARGMEVLQSLRAAGVGMPVLLFSVLPASQYAGFARKAGAQGFVSKDETGQALLQAVREVAAGRLAFPVARRANKGGVNGGNPFAGLSRREFEVMQGLIRGDNLTSIARSLGVGVKSVTTYRRRILDKLAISSNAELAALAARFGVI